jgi:hypothetical protein
MRSRPVLTAGLVVVAALIVVALAWGQGGGFGGGFGGPPGPPPGGRMGGPPGEMQAMTYLEKSWTAVSFQLAGTAEQQKSLKATYATELETRNQALGQAIKKRDMNAMQKARETCKTNLNGKLKEVLTDEQWQKLQKVMQPVAPLPPPN